MSNPYPYTITDETSDYPPHLNVMLDSLVERARLSYGQALDKVLGDLLAEGMTTDDIVLEQHPGRTIVVAKGARIAELTFGYLYNKHPTAARKASP